MPSPTVTALCAAFTLGACAPAAARRVVDSHVHLASLSRFAYAGDWVHTSHSLADFVDDSGAGGGGCSGLGDVAKVVFVQASVVTNASVGEVAFYAAAGREASVGAVPGAPEVGAIVAYVPLEAGRAAAEHYLDAMAPAADGLLRGVRRILELTPPSGEGGPCWFTEPAHEAKFLEGLQVLAERGLHFELLTRNSSQFDCAASLMEKAPQGLRVILDHIGAPDMNNPAEFRTWGAFLRRLRAALPTLYVKVSGVPERAVGKENPWNAWTFQQVRPYIDEALDVFGWGRVVYGGNWFVVANYASYKGWTGALAKALALRNATAGQLDALMWDNAHAMYRL
eukprot:TRINITY_DN4151_c0_g4_i2.p2 TRINITY_DN4151_c0_g4~~TRINITY_DN4151_c0_g4_i2.p2  ORF type:complete len:339 (+),score=121.26 TRINITY_DN4151_c0_g4_i2:69-1085(+)